MPETAGMHHYIGLMSGTSVDGIDAALVTIGEHSDIRLVASHQHHIPDDLRDAIRALMQPDANELDREGKLDMQLGALFADAANALLRKHGFSANQIRAIGSHGQTVRHRPHARHPFTRQLGNPSVIAERTGITTVADFRARDIAAGGEGAPLVPAFHQAVFSKTGTNRAIVNIGGIANITWLPDTEHKPVIGFDTGPGNTLLDHWAQQQLRQPCDRDGAWATQGKVIEPLLSQLLNEPYFSRAAPKSTGRELFNAEWLNVRLTGKEAPADVQATLAELTARSVANALPNNSCEIFLCGGGAHNHDLVQRIEQQLPGVPIKTTAALGVDPDWVEAMAFAWLAHQTLAGKPGNLPSVTGARHAVPLGGVYIG
jgi:anhydro-N-acetylmuramic acid kinase